MATSSDRRRLARERKLIRSHSRWLQKVLFALSKAQSEQEKLEKLRGESAEPVTVTIGGTSFPIEDVTAAIREAVDEWLAPLRGSRKTIAEQLR